MVKLAIDFSFFSDMLPNDDPCSRITRAVFSWVEYSLSLRSLLCLPCFVQILPDVQQSSYFEVEVEHTNMCVSFACVVWLTNE